MRAGLSPGRPSALEAAPGTPRDAHLPETFCISSHEEKWYSAEAASTP